MSRPTAISAGHDWPIAPPGIWLEARSQPSEWPRPGLFLDRDGVIVGDNGFLATPDDVELLPGAAELIAEANRHAVPVAVVTNQSGIARQLFGWAAFADVEREITRRLAAAGARLDAVLACPFHPEFTADYGEVESHWRKPGPGLLLAAARLLNIDIGMSWLVGDQIRDIDAARNAGLAGAILLSGEVARRPRKPMRSDQDTGFRVPVAATTSESLAILKDVGLLGGR
jgi:D-glycero-D-manno-heptose 1,7-bisphosphate phosphatase